MYRSAGTLQALGERLRAVLESLSPQWEIILVDDASPDGAWSQMQALRRQDSRVRIIRLAHNHGQQHATLCGLNYARGEYVVTIDDDLQCQPEDMPQFIDQLRAGYHAVIGRIERGQKQHRWWRNLGSTLNQSLAVRILGKPPGLSLSSYRAFSRRAVDRMVAYKGAHPHIAALMLRAVPLEYITNVDISHTSRADQTGSSYSLPKLIKTASYLLINHSYLPLRFMIAWGVLISVASLSFACWVAFKVLFFGSAIPGWASLAVLISFLSGNVLLALGVIGEYVGRLVEEDSRQEQFAVFEEEV